MRPLPLTVILVSLLAFSSCYSYQYITLDSAEVTKDDSKNFTWENDTLRLVYSYYGPGGPLWMSITNKLDKPMYINWKKSAIIYEGKSVSLYSGNVRMTGSFDVSRVYNSTSGSLASSFNVPEGMDFIPPASHIDKSVQVYATDRLVYKNKLTSKPQILKAKSSTGPSSYTYTQYSFDQASSPMHFSNYLTFVLGSNNATEISVSHSFYIQKVMLSSTSPGLFSLYRRQGDMFYMVQ